MKKILSALICLLAIVGPVCAAGAEEAETVTETFYFTIPDTDAFEDYAGGLFEAGGGMISTFSYHENLTGVNKQVYDDILPKLRMCADGTLDTTYFSILKDRMAADGGWTVPMSSVENRTVMSVLQSKYGFSGTVVGFSLIRDYPQLFFWGKGQQCGVSYSYYTSGDTAKISELYLVFDIENTYKRYPEATDFYKSHMLDTTRAADTQAAYDRADAAKANAISYVEQARGMTDMQKLRFYAETIADLNEYNTQAASGGSAGIGTNEPWKLVWVFDGDPETNVVCEGYAKAFKYLCDMSDFSDPTLEVYCVTGNCGGPHMWNIVEMWDGSYHVDVTNCDQSFGFSETLFMVYPQSGSVSAGYTFPRFPQYTYDENTLEMLPESTLTLGPRTAETLSLGENELVTDSARATFTAHISARYSFDSEDAWLDIFTADGRVFPDDDGMYSLERGDGLRIKVYAYADDISITVNSAMPADAVAYTLKAQNGLELGAEAFAGDAVEALVVVGGTLTLDAGALDGSDIGWIVFGDDSADVVLADGAQIPEVFVFGDSANARAFARSYGLERIS